MSAPILRFLADESCDHAVVRALRSAGWDVLAVGEQEPGATDREVIDPARREQRVLLTEDKDFGWLVYVSHVRSPGVVLMRFPGHARRELLESMERLVREHGDRLRGAFTVAQPGHVRISTRS